MTYTKAVQGFSLLRKSATFSNDDVYRYRLDRDLQATGITLAFIMVNPSKADHEINDPTITKCMGFARVLKARRLVVGNLFAFAATDIKELRTAEDPIGPENNQYLTDILGEANTVIVGWGSLMKLPERLRGRWKLIPNLARQMGRPLHCFDTCDGGHPRHPLMTPYSVPLTRWSIPKCR